MKRLFRIALILVIVIAIVVVGGPPLAKNYFNKNSKELLQRNASLKSLSFNPFTGSISAKELAIFEANNSAVFSGFRELYINIHIMKLMTGKIRIEEIMLDSPYVHVINDKGIFNFNDLVPEDDSTQIESEPAEGSNIEFVIENLQMRKGHVGYYEKELDHNIVMNDLSFRLPRFAYNSYSANMDVQFVIDETGLLSMSNNFYPEESRFVSNIRLRGLHIDLAKPYLKDYIITEDIDGLASCDINIEGDFKDSTQIRLNGLAWLRQLNIKDTSTIPMFTADSVCARLTNIDFFQNRYEIDEVYTKNFSLRFDMMDTTNNLMLAFAPMMVEEDTLQQIDSLKENTESSLSYEIDTFIVFNSTILYRDYSLDNYFEYNISNINALANNIRSDDNQAKFSSTGLLNQQGRYNANLLFDPNNPLNFILDFAVKGFQMEDISPFTLTYAGHPIFQGELIYSGKTVVDEGIMDSQNEITVYNLQVGDKVTKNVLYAMPMKFAVFLLKDKDGVVNLELPMDGNMNDPNFKFGPLVWQVIRQNLLKIVAAPGKLLASQFGMKEEDIQYVAFEPLDTLLTEEASNTLLRLQELIDNKQGLLVELAYYSPSDFDIQKIALRMAKERYVGEKFNPSTKERAIQQISKVADNDIHFVTYLKKEMEPEVVPNDSLAIYWIGMEKLLTQAAVLQQKREKSVKSFIKQTDSLYLNKIRFTELLDIPNFPVEQSGYVVNFDME